MPSPISVYNSRFSQIAAICNTFSDVPVPRGLSAKQVARMMEVVWIAGYETGKEEIKNRHINVNTERKRQCFDAVNGMSIEDERLMLLVIYIWTAGLLSARDEAGISGSQHPSDKRLDRVIVEDG